MIDITGTISPEGVASVTLPDVRNDEDQPVTADIWWGDGQWSTCPLDGSVVEHEFTNAFKSQFRTVMPTLIKARQLTRVQPHSVMASQYVRYTAGEASRVEADAGERDTARAEDEGVEGAQVGQPWRQFNRHQDFDDYLNHNGIAPPDDYGSMTLQRKRDWLDEQNAR